jgi:hypothetical protein
VRRYIQPGKAASQGKVYSSNTDGGKITAVLGAGNLVRDSLLTGGGAHV